MPRAGDSSGARRARGIRWPRRSADRRDPIALGLAPLIAYLGTLAACQFETRLLYGYLPLPAEIAKQEGLLAAASAG